MSRTFVARYPGLCPDCGEGIEPGDTIAFNEEDRVAHADCQNLPERAVEEPERACSICHLTSCDCDWETPL